MLTYILPKFKNTCNKLNKKEGFFVKKVVIIGAGMIGATAAYELVQKGIKVTLIDSHRIGRATSAAAGIICPWITQRRNQAWYVLAKKGAEYYEELIASLHEDGESNTGYKKVGAIRLHTEKERLEKLKEIALSRRETAPQIGEVKLLNKEDTKAMFPYVRDNFYSLFISGGARVDGNALRESLIRASVKRGATYIQGEAGLTFTNNEVTGVKIGTNYIEADETICSNGVWMPNLLKPLNINLNISSQKGEIIHLHTTSMDTSSLPVVMPPNNQYLLCFDDNRIVIGATHINSNEFDTNMTAGGAFYILDQALQVAPSLSDCTITETRVGFRPFTFNHLPIFGRLPTYNRILIANGLGASGLTTGPFIGKQLAKLVSNDTLDVHLEAYKVEQALK